MKPAKSPPAALADFIERGRRAQEAADRVLQRQAHPQQPATTRRGARKNNPRYQGIAVALAELARAHMEPDLALLVLASLGLSVADLKDAGADPYDLEALDIEQ